MTFNPAISGQTARGVKGSEGIKSSASGRFIKTQALDKIKANWKNQGIGPVYASATFSPSSPKSLKS